MERNRRTQRSCSESSKASETSSGVDWTSGSIGPAVFHVRLDGRRIFGQGQLEADVGVHVALGHVMGDLPHGPSAIAIGSFDLLRREALDRGTQGRGSMCDVVDEFLTLFLVRRAVEGKFSDGITWVAHVFLHHHEQETRKSSEKQWRTAIRGKFKDRCCLEMCWLGIEKCSDVRRNCPFAVRLSGSLARAWPLFRPVEQCARFLSRFEQMRKRGAAGSEYLVTQREVGLNLCSCGMLRLSINQRIG